MMFMRLIAKYRHFIKAVAAIVCVAGLIFFGIKVQKLKDVDVKADTFSGQAMGTAIKKSIYAENRTQREQANRIVDDCLGEIENQLSVRMPDSEVSRCNRSYAIDGLYELPEDIIGYLKQEMAIYKETNGAFSPCILPITDLWGIEDGDDIVPEQTAIEDTLKVSNAADIEVKEDGIVFHNNNMAIDFGAVGKGIAGDRIVSELAKTDIQGAVISVGGSIAVYGDKGDGKEWHIGIQDPRAIEGEVLGIVDVEGGKMIATSGDYEKYFEQDGKRYHHIFDPATGYPADSGLISVTIISDSGFLSDALSTACFVMGLEKGMAYAEEKEVEAIFVTSDKEVYITKGLKKIFRIQADEYTLKS